MKLDSDPGRSREFAVLWMVMLIALALASLSDFLQKPSWTPPVDVSDPADYGDLQGVLIEPWIPRVQLPDASTPTQVHAHVDVAVESPRL